MDALLLQQRTQRLVAKGMGRVLLPEMDQQSLLCCLAGYPLGPTGRLRKYRSG